MPLFEILDVFLPIVRILQQNKMARKKKELPLLERIEITGVAAEGKALLKKAAALTGRSAKDEVQVIISNEPARYEMLHRAVGELLEKMGKIR